jgi:hypothetical protein
MTKRQLLYTAIAPGLVGLVGIALQYRTGVLGRSRNATLLFKLDTIKRGMTEAEVEQIMDRETAGVAWPSPQRVKQWSGDELAVLVFFGPEGTVKSTRVLPDLSPFDHLKHRLGW